MDNSESDCKSKEKKGKRDVCRRPNKDFNSQSSDCRRCASYETCQKRRDFVINGVELTEEEFNNFFGG